jgi:MFS family permease
MTRAPDRLFTPLFFVMCAFSFTVFVSVFCLLPTMPFRILALGGTKADAGLFLGFLTYASALSAPVTGALADRVGKRRMLIVCSLAIACFSVAYAYSPRYQWMLGLAFAHGVFWSGLLSASAAYMTDIIPEARRAEGIGYWGLSTIAAVAVAPTLGLWLYGRSWRTMCLTTTALDLTMAAIAFSLREARSPARRGGERFFHLGMLEWRVAVLSLTLFLYSFAYGGITSFSALYAEANGVTPKSLYLLSLAAVILVSRPLLVPRVERFGHRRMFLACLCLIVAGLALLAVGGSRPWLIASAVVFGVGFGIAYPVYVAYVMRHVDPARRGAAFGGILAAFDTGIGTGSIAVGWLVEHQGFRFAFGFAAGLAALSLPFFLTADRLLQPRA